MYIEFFGLPGAGKSTLVRTLKEKDTTYVSARGVSLLWVPLFIFQHPIITAYWIIHALLESVSVRKFTLVRFKWSLLLHTFAQVVYAERSRERVILDEGFLQRALSVFETKKTHGELLRAIAHTIPADAYVEVVGEEPLFARYKRPGADRGKSGQEYLAHWEDVVRHNYKTLLQVLAERKISYRTYVRARDTVEEIDHYLTYL